MTPERHKHIGEIFHAALQVDETQRGGFLDLKCAGDDDLRREVESLIASHENASDFIATPALAVAAELLAKSEASSLIGQTIARYKIVSLLGEGGMGRVYLAEDTGLGRRVALKLLPEAFTHDEERMRRFKQEARAASALNHPNILTVHEIGRVGTMDFIATEFIEGQTLRALMAQARPRLAQAVDVAAQVAEALAAAHAAGVVHRDIKPENIMLRPDGYVKVLDFGLAKVASQVLDISLEASTVAKVETNPGVVMGTIQYMSPEQARGLQVDARTDVWTLGVVIYEMVAGRYPFEGETQSDTIVSILEREPAPLLRYAPEVPAELERIVTKALTKDRNERYQTVKDMAIDLRRFRRRLDVEAEMERSAQAPSSGEGIAPVSSGGQRVTAETGTQGAARESEAGTTRTTSSIEYVVGEIRRHKRGAALVGVALILFLGVVGYGTFRLFSSLPTPLGPFQTTKVMRVTTSGRATIAAISPDGKYVVYSEEDGKLQALWVKQVSTGSSVQVVPPANAGYWGLTFSNDGDYIYYVRNERDADGGAYNKLYRLPALGGAPKKLLEQVDSAVAFSPEGERLAFVRDNLKKEETEIVLANADGSGEQTLATRKAPERFASDLTTRIAWSRDGKTIACGGVSADKDGYYQNLIGVSVEDGSEKHLTSQRWVNINQVSWLADGRGLVIVASDEESTQAAPQLWYVPLPEGRARRITNDLSRYRDASITANSNALVTVQTNPVSNIWLTPKADPSHAKQLTFSTFDTTPAWTPDGHIVYGSNASGRPNIWTMDADGGQQRQLTHDGQNFRPRVSTDGRYIFFTSTRAGKTNIWRMDSDGGNQKPLTDGKSNAHPYPSPDGKWIVFISRDQGNGTLWKMPVEGGKPVRLSEPTVNLPVISPDGKQIACYYWDEQANPPRGVMILPFEGELPAKRFQIANTGSAFDLDWSSDGRALLFIRNILSVWSQPVEGGLPRQLMEFQGDELFNLAYSPDDKWLAVARGKITTDVVLISNSQ